MGGARSSCSENEKARLFQRVDQVGPGTAGSRGTASHRRGAGGFLQAPSPPPLHLGPSADFLDWRSILENLLSHHEMSNTLPVSWQASTHLGAGAVLGRASCRARQHLPAGLPAAFLPRPEDVGPQGHQGTSEQGGEAADPTSQSPRVTGTRISAQGPSSPRTCTLPGSRDHAGSQLPSLG